MAQRHPYTYQFASSSSHGILKDGVHNSEPSLATAMSASERTPLIQEQDIPRQVRMGKAKQTHTEQTSPSSPPPSQVESVHEANGRVPRSDNVSRLPPSPTKLPTGARGVALSLQNSGSVARDHLASERTFLAYVRTSLAIASAGVGLAQILSFTEFYMEDDRKRSRRVEAYARPLGATAVVLALLVLLIGVTRYFSVQQALVKGRFPVARVGIALMGGLLGALVVTTFGILTHDLLKRS